MDLLGQFQFGQVDYNNNSHSPQQQPPQPSPSFNNAYSSQIPPFNTTNNINTLRHGPPSQTTTPKILDHPKFVRNIAIDRCSNFVNSGANGNDVNLLSQLYKARTHSEEYISLKVYSVPGLERISFVEAIQQDFRPTRLGEWFGPSWSTHWFHIKCCIPYEYRSEEVQFIWNADNEAMIWSMEGEPLQGLTGGVGIDARHEYILTTDARGGEVLEFYIEMACNGMFGTGNGLIGPPDPNRFFNLNQADLAVPNKLAWELLYDFQVILGMAKDLPEDSLRGCQALHAANSIMNSFIPGDDVSIMKCLALSLDFLKAENGDSQHTIYVIGHCHIDSAWLWPFRETIRKSARSWSSQINLMDRYPEYKFICSQAQQFEWVKEKYVPLWERILEKIRDGQFMPIGGTWVEMDTTMPCGESLSRQFLLGQRFFERNFGKRSKVFWLPDSFGYSSQLPQLMKLADMKYFFTQKLSWNNVNKFPHTTFWWIGLDGTAALTHMTPSETDSAQCVPEEMIRSVKNHKDKIYSNKSLMIFGNGDGGGGPLPSMIERLKRMKNVDGLPKATIKYPDEFYQDVERTSVELPSWKGELYFELHRGVYTTQAFCKKLNRSCEGLLRDLEMLGTLAHLLYPDSFQYPKNEFDEFWKLLCLTQFHDVITGSAIEMVYDDCLEMYTKIDVLGRQIRKDIITKLLGVDENATNNSNDKGIVVINTLPWERNEIIEIPTDIEGLPTLQQYSALGNNSGYIMATQIAPLKATGFSLDTGLKGYEPVKVSSDAANMICLENQFISATFDTSGHLLHLFDKAMQRELIKPGERGNVFKMHEDVPLFWDAWDVEMYHLEKYRIVEEGSIQIVEQGPLRVSLQIEKKLSNTSRLRQIVILTAVSPRLDFDTSVDWNENRQLLKVEFAFDILTDYVNYESQYGFVQRPTHFNTSWDSAKFEVVAQKFADMSEHGYGVALLNDCKYGYSAHRNVLRLSLLKSPKAPDMNCDMGHHSFRYAIYPHQHHFLQSDVVREGYNFNTQPLTRVIPRNKVNDIGDSIPQFRIENANNVVLDTMKRAEDSNDIILRLYEAYGGHARARLISPHPIQKMIKCNILEDEIEEIPISSTATVDRTFSTNLRVLDDDIVELQQQAQERELNKGVLIQIKPFEVITLKITF